VEKWENYVFIKESTDKVYCMKRNECDYVDDKYIGRLVKRT
jgi:hypothetical protein